MGWKEFFKPNKFKLLVLFVLVILYFLDDFLSITPNSIFDKIYSAFLILYLPIIILIFLLPLPMEHGFWLALGPYTLKSKIIIFVIVVIYAYLLSGIIEIIYRKIKK